MRILNSYFVPVTFTFFYFYDGTPFRIISIVIHSSGVVCLTRVSQRCVCAIEVFFRVVGCSGGALSRFALQRIPEVFGSIAALKALSSLKSEHVQKPAGGTLIKHDLTHLKPIIFIRTGVVPSFFVHARDVDKIGQLNGKNQ